MAYGEPATVADADAPPLVRVTLLTVSLLIRPLVVNSVPPKVSVVPYVLLALLAVTVNAFGVTVRLPVT